MCLYNVVWLCYFRTDIALAIHKTGKEVVGKYVTLLLGTWLKNM